MAMVRAGSISETGTRFARGQFLILGFA